MKLSKKQQKWLDRYVVGEWRIDKDEMIKICGSLDIQDHRVQVVPVDIFSVSGNVEVCNNSWNDSQLSTLYNFPKFVGGHVILDCPRLHSMRYGPVFVGSIYYIARSNIITLNGAPKYIGGDMNMSESAPLGDIRAMPRFVGLHTTLNVTNPTKIVAEYKSIHGRFIINQKFDAVCRKYRIPEHNIGEMPDSVKYLWKSMYKNA
jgi:hypothetical protein